MVPPLPRRSLYVLNTINLAVFGATLGLCAPSLPRSPSFSPALCPDSHEGVISSLEIDDVQPRPGTQLYTLSTDQDVSRMNPKEVILAVSTPQQALDVLCRYVRTNGLDPRLQGAYYASFDQIHLRRTPMDCTEGAEVAASTLADNGYPPLFLIMAPPHKSIGDRVIAVSDDYGKICTKNGLDLKFIVYGHAVFLYKEGGRFRYIDINDCYYGSNAQAFDSVGELVQSIAQRLQIPFQDFCIFDKSKVASSRLNNNQTIEALSKEWLQWECYPE